MIVPQKKMIGLDIGSACVKVIVCERRGRALQLLGGEVLNAREEGILNDAELYDSIREWLQTHGLGGCHAAVGMPQYLTTTLVRDLPAVDHHQLAGMVQLETRQLAGLSDESFVQDFQSLPPGGGRKHPVLLAICLESAIRDRLRHMDAIGLPVDELSMTGLAMINAFTQLQPGAFACPKPTLLLDLGRDNATAAIWFAGQPLFIGSLLFAGERFEQALAAKGRRGASLNEVNLADEAPHSPFVEAARLLENEIHGAVEHWRNQENAELANQPIDKVFLCGGASRLRGLSQWLQNRLECPVELLGPEMAGVVRPEMTVAYGLALQGCGQAELRLSMLPPAMRWQKKRLQRWPFLAAALALVALLGFALEGICWRGNARAITTLNGVQRQLDQCGLLASRLESSLNALQVQESKLIPLVAMGNQADRIAAALAALGQARGEKDWIVYLGDELSFQTTRAAAIAKRTQRQAAGPNRGAAAPAGMFGSAVATKGAPEKAFSSEFPRRALPVDFRYPDAYIAAGYAPRQEDHVYESVRNLIGKLSESGTFAKVDILPEVECDGREDIFLPWLDYLRRQPGGRERLQYRDFTIRMPFAARLVQPPAPAPEKKKGGRGL